jgi:hypothetical protein
VNEPFKTLYELDRLGAEARSRSEIANKTWERGYQAGLADAYSNAIRLLLQTIKPEAQ